MSTDKKIPGQENHKDLEDTAINKKSNEADGKQINHQVKDKREQHQPRDTA